MAISGLIAGFVILSLFLSMLTSSPRPVSPQADESPTDTRA